MIINDILTRTILKKTQILNGCETFAFKYISYLLFFLSFCIQSFGNNIEN